MQVSSAMTAVTSTTARGQETPIERTETPPTLPKQGVGNTLGKLAVGAVGGMAGLAGATIMSFWIAPRGPSAAMTAASLLLGGVGGSIAGYSAWKSLSGEQHRKEFAKEVDHTIGRSTLDVARRSIKLGDDDQDGSIQAHEHRATGYAPADANGDSVVTDVELARLLSRHDSNRNGALTPDERAAAQAEWPDMPIYDNHGFYNSEALEYKD